MAEFSQLEVNGVQSKRQQKFSTLAPPVPTINVTSRPTSALSMMLPDMELDSRKDGVLSRADEVPGSLAVLAGKGGLSKTVARVIQMNQIAKEEIEAESETLPDCQLPLGGPDCEFLEFF